MKTSLRVCLNAIRRLDLVRDSLQEAEPGYVPGDPDDATMGVLHVGFQGPGRDQPLFSISEDVFPERDIRGVRSVIGYRVQEWVWCDGGRDEPGCWDTIELTPGDYTRSPWECGRIIALRTQDALIGAALTEWQEHEMAEAARAGEEDDRMMRRISRTLEDAAVVSGRSEW